MLFDPSTLTPAQLAQLYPPQPGLLNAPQPAPPSSTDIHGLLAAPVASTAPATPAAHQGLLGRIGSALGRAGAAVDAGLFPTDPNLTPNDTAAARKQALLNAGLAMMAASGPHVGVRPSFGQILAASLPVGQQTYQAEVQQRHLAELHDHIRQAVPLDPNAPLQDQLTALGRIGTMYAQAGVPDMAASIGELMGKMKASANPGTWQIVNDGQNQYRVNLQTGEKQLVGPVRPTQQGRYSSVPLGDRITLIDHQTGQIVDPVTRKPIASSSIGITPTADARIAAQAAQHSDQLAAAFDRSPSVSPILKGIPAFVQFNASSAQAGAGNKAARESALFALVRAVDPGTPLRIGVIHLLQNIDPSFAGMTENNFDKYMSGTWSPATLAAMKQLVQSHLTGYMASYDQQAASYEAAHPGVHIPRAVERFPSMAGAVPTQRTSPNGTSPSGYSAGNPFAPKP